MGNYNQFKFIEDNANIIEGSILEIGSKDYGNTPDFRKLFPGVDYLGVDAEEGKGVDVKLDLTNNLSDIQKNIGDKKYNAIICFSVLEHCRNPFKMCENITKLLNVGGLVFISVPFVWEIHGYPSDYWRFTPEGVRVLLPDFDFDVYPGNMSTTVQGKTKKLNSNLMMFDLNLRRLIQSGRYIRALFLAILKVLRIVRKDSYNHYYFPPVMINMIGVKKK